MSCSKLCARYISAELADRILRGISSLDGALLNLLKVSRKGSMILPERLHVRLRSMPNYVLGKNSLKFLPTSE